MSLHIFVDTRSSSFQSFQQNSHIAAFHEYTLTLIRNYCTLQNMYPCILPLRSLLVNSSPSATQLVRITSSTSLSTTLRPRFSCTGTPSSIVTRTWSMMQEALNLVVESISPYEKNDKVRDFMTCIMIFIIKNIIPQ